jgi:hypothetical protein
MKRFDSGLTQGFKRSVVLYLAATLAAAQIGCKPQPKNEIPTVSLKQYLTGLEFRGHYIGEINIGSTAKGGRVTQDAVLWFGSGSSPPDPHRGPFTLKIGSRVVNGEWNYAFGWVNLWIDMIDGKPISSTTNSMSFRPPRHVDDGWLSEANLVDPASTVFPGQLAMRNVEDSRYHEMTNGVKFSPSRTLILLPE